jgi:hypothetical protein
LIFTFGCFCAKTELLPFELLDSLGFSKPGVPILDDFLDPYAEFNPDVLQENNKMQIKKRENKNFIFQI